MTIDTELRLHQCPYCWHYETLVPRVGNQEGHECVCGEVLTYVDLRRERWRIVNEDGTVVTTARSFEAVEKWVDNHHYPDPILEYNFGTGEFGSGEWRRYG